MSCTQAVTSCVQLQVMEVGANSHFFASIHCQHLRGKTTKECNETDILHFYRAGRERALCCSCWKSSVNTFSRGHADTITKMSKVETKTMLYFWKDACQTTVSNLGLEEIRGGA